VLCCRCPQEDDRYLMEDGVSDLPAEFPAHGCTACTCSSLQCCSVCLCPMVPSNFLGCSVHCVPAAESGS